MQLKQLNKIHMQLKQLTIIHIQLNNNNYPNFQCFIIHLSVIFSLICDVPHFNSPNIPTSLNFLYVLTKMI